MLWKRGLLGVNVTEGWKPMVYNKEDKSYMLTDKSCGMCSIPTANDESGEDRSIGDRLIKIDDSGEDRCAQDEMSSTSSSAISDPVPLALVDRLNIECLGMLL